MKKKCLSFLCILLVLCTLLSSCGTLQPPFLQLLGDSVSGFFSNAKNLLQGNTPLIIENEVKFCLEQDGNAADAVASLQATIREKTGHDFSENTDENAPKLRIGLNLADTVTAADYYIGFVEDDLLITAASDVMLAEALRYFENTLIKGEKANCGNGYLFVSGDMDFTGETVQLISSSGTPHYSVAYPENADATTFAAVTQLVSDIRGATGVNLSLQDSYFQSKNSPDTKEFLIGLTQKDESIEATEKLDHSSYYIGIQGNKIIITAKNSYMLSQAVARFSELFVTHEKAAASYETHTLSLPAALSLTHNETLISLSINSISEYTLIYPANADTRLVDEARAFCTSVYYLTGAAIPMSADDRQTEGKKEILVGDTNRHASALAGVRMDAAHWTVSTAGEQLVVSGKSANPLCAALSALLQELTAYAEAQNIKGKDENGNLQTVLPMLCLPATFTMQGANAPDIPSLTQHVVLGENAYMLYRTECSAADYQNYLTTLEYCDFTLHQERQAGNVLSAVYYNDHEILNITFSTADNTLRVVTDPRTEAALTPLEATPYLGRTDVEPLFIQIGEIYGSSNRGMSYVIRLCDGTFVVVDGGYGSDAYATTAGKIINTLQQYNQIDGLPVISCWIFTSADYAYNGAFIYAFSERYRDKVILQNVLYSFPNRDQLRGIKAPNAHYLQVGFRENINRFPGDTVFYKARTGQVLQFAGCEIETLFTFEDFGQPKTLANLQESTTVFRFSLSFGSITQTILMMGDATTATSKLLTARYGPYLKSDAVQLAHHDKTGAANEFFDTVAAANVFWACNKANFNNAAWGTNTRRMLGQNYAKVLYAAWKGTSAVSLTHLANRTIADSVAGMPAADGVLT